MNQSKKKYYFNLAQENLNALLYDLENYGGKDRFGRRYRIGVYYVLSGKYKLSEKYYNQYSSFFNDDSGEPISELYWALSEFKNNKHVNACNRLKIAMIKNIYMLPYILGELIQEHNIWHSSNWAGTDYLFHKNVNSYLKNIDDDTRKWIKNQYKHKDFCELQNKYIDTFSALKKDEDLKKRSYILDSWKEFVERRTKLCTLNE